MWTAFKACFHQKPWDHGIKLTTKNWKARFVKNIAEGSKIEAEKQEFFFDCKLREILTLWILHRNTPFQISIIVCWEFCIILLFSIYIQVVMLDEIASNLTTKNIQPSYKWSYKRDLGLMQWKVDTKSTSYFYWTSSLISHSSSKVQVSVNTISMRLQLQHFRIWKSKIMLNTGENLLKVWRNQAKFYTTQMEQWFYGHK